MSANFNFCLNFNDVDLLSESVRDWNLEFRQLKKGPFRGQIIQTARNGWLVSSAVITKATEQIGTPPAGMRTIVITGHENTSLIWRGHEVHSNHLMIFPDNGELHAVGNHKFNILSFSFYPQQFIQTSQSCGTPLSINVLDQNDLLRLPSQKMALLRYTLKSVIQMASLNEKDHPLLPDALKVFISILASATASPEQKTILGKGELVLSHAIKILQNDIKNQLSMSSVAQLLQVSPRTMDSAFLNFFGVTPAAYRKAIRLNAVHRHLRHPDMQAARVKDIASAYGFIHMSQFATDYREHFGVLPSESLKNGLVRISDST